VHRAGRICPERRPRIIAFSRSFGARRSEADVVGAIVAPILSMSHSHAFLFGSLIATFALGCGGPTKPASAIRHAPSEVVGTTARCEKVCDIEARAASLNALCDQIVERTKSSFEVAPKCAAERPIGMWSDTETAVHDAAIVNLTVNAKSGAKKYALLAISTERGWELAREVASLGTSDGSKSSLEVTAVRPVELPELAPYGVEVKVRVDGEDGKATRVFVCGVQGGAVKCPVAIDTI